MPGRLVRAPLEGVDERLNGLEPLTSWEAARRAARTNHESSICAYFALLRVAFLRHAWSHHSSEWVAARFVIAPLKEADMDRRIQIICPAGNVNLGSQSRPHGVYRVRDLANVSWHISRLRAFHRGWLYWEFESCVLGCEP